MGTFVRRGRPRLLTASDASQVVEVEPVEVPAHVLTDVGPHGEQDALALVVARAVGVGLPEVADGDGAVDGRDDVAERDRRWVSGEHVPAADAPLGADEASALQREEDLLEVRLRERGASSDVTNRDRRVHTLQDQRQQGSAGIVPSSGYTHRGIVGEGG